MMELTYPPSLPRSAVASGSVTTRGRGKFPQGNGRELLAWNSYVQCLERNRQRWQVVEIDIGLWLVETAF